MAFHSSYRKMLLGVPKLCRDIATLLDNRQASDVQFKVGGSISTQENGETIYNESATVTLYAHSLILRCRSPYFATLLDSNKDWKEKSKCIIYKPEISPNTLRSILRYIYTGDVRTNNSDNIFELITVANEMGLIELCTEYQSEFMRAIKSIFSNEDEPKKNDISIDVAIRTHIIPVLNLASNHSLSNLSQELLTTMLPHMTVITKSPNAYTDLINEVSSEALIKIISSDDLALVERSVCDLAIDWACRQTKLSKTAIETRLSNIEYDEEGGEDPSDDGTISRAQLKQFKKILTPLLPSIRFGLLDPDEYISLVNTLSYILPRRRYLEINEYLLNPNGTRLLDTPRKIYSRIIVKSKIVVEPIAGELLRKNIFETGGIAGCRTLNDLKFSLLFRASKHGFSASSFHSCCDEKGPTLVIVRSGDGHLFGGVNFSSWKSPYWPQPTSYSSSTLNFLFALPDGRHRKNSEIFKIKKSYPGYSSYNNSKLGPIFGGSLWDSLFDLCISNDPNTNQESCSYLPSCYYGNEASKTSLAGSHNFIVSDYEVFAISK